MIRWVFAMTVVVAIQGSLPWVGTVKADELPMLERLAMLRKADGGISRQPAVDDRHAQARTCKAVSSCEEAVRLWCGGYRRADGDNDGIPCENVCSSLAQVEVIKAEIGC